MLSVTRSLSQGTTIAFRLPWPVANCSIAPGEARGEPLVVNSRSFFVHGKTVVHWPSDRTT